MVRQRQRQVANDLAPQLMEKESMFESSGNKGPGIQMRVVTHPNSQPCRWSLCFFSQADPMISAEGGAIPKWVS